MPYSLEPGSKNVFKGIRHDMWQWEQELFDGTKTTFECVTRKDSATVIAFLDPETILLIEQIQAGRGVPFLDPPGGVIEPDETPEQAARREFLEETGYEIGTMELFRRHDFGGASRYSTYIFLAAGLKFTNRPSPDAGERITLRPTPFEEAVQLSLSNRMRQGWAMLDILALKYDEEARKQMESLMKRQINA